MAMAREGAAVVVADRDAVAGEATARSIAKGMGRAKAIATDVADPAALERLVAGTIEAYGRIDVLHSHAGIQIEGLSPRLTRPAWMRPGGSMSPPISAWRGW